MYFDGRDQDMGVDPGSGGVHSLPSALPNFFFGGGTNVDVMSIQFLLVMYICAYDTVV